MIQINSGTDAVVSKSNPYTQIYTDKEKQRYRSFNLCLICVNPWLNVSDEFA